MKVKVPKYIEIGSLTGSVSFADNIRVDDGWRATYNQRTAKLEIDKSCGMMTDRTFLHEVVHMIDINYEVDLNEQSISRIANGIYEFMINNLGLEFDWQDIN